MMDIFKRIKYFFLAIKEKNLQNKLKNTTKRSYSNKTSKTVYGNAADLTLSARTEQIILDVRNNVSAIVKKTNCNPDELLEYVKAAKTPVYKIDYADRLLRVIQEEEGLITPQQGLSALYLSLITHKIPKWETEPMFVMRKGNIDKFYLLHHFYRWYSLKADLPGFDKDSQKLLKLFLQSEDENVFNSLSMERILNLKEAIARDQEATDFVLGYTKQIDGSKNVLNKIKEDGSAQI